MLRYGDSAWCLQLIHLYPQYGVIAEILAHAGHIGSEVMNCSAPDTGNMGVHDLFFFLQEFRF